jgi:hypothetical protein
MKPARTPWWVPLAGFGCALIPLALMARAAALAAGAGRVFMGELQTDQYYYFACARAMLERGNGVAYPNPYDASPAPVLYSHLYALLLAWVPRFVPLGPLGVDYAVRLGAGALLAMGLWRLVTLLFEEHARRRAVFWIVLLGGGCVWLEAARRTLASGGGAAFTAEFRAADIADGWWFQNVLRNYFYATETLYHALALWLLYALAARRSWLACACFALLLYAHPYTGGQFVAIVGAWIVVERLAGAWALPPLPLAFLAASAAAFVFYNGVWLLQFPSHVEVVERFRTVGYYSDALPYLWVYGPWLVLAPAALWYTRRTWARSAAWRLLVCELAVTAALMQNHWILGTERPLEPLHFTHGWEFLPMALLVLAWLLPRHENALVLRSAPVLATLVLALSLDNVGFLPTAYEEALHFTLTVPEHEMLLRLGALDPPETVVSSRPLLQFLVPSFTHHRVLVGYTMLTPDYAARSAELHGWVAGTNGLLTHHPQVTAVVVTDDEGDRLEQRGELRHADFVLATPGLRLYRVPTSPTPRPS